MDRLWKDKQISNPEMQKNTKKKKRNKIKTKAENTQQGG